MRVNLPSRHAAYHGESLQCDSETNAIALIFPNVFITTLTTPSASASPSNVSHASKCAFTTPAP